MKYAILILSLTLMGCSTKVEQDNCFEDTLVKIIDYDGNLSYKLYSMFVYPEKHFDVEEGKRYIWCIDENKTVISVSKR